MALLIRTIRRAAALTLCLALAPPQARAQADALEYAVKANDLYKFGPFVEWPAGVFAAPGSPFNVCVFGEDPFRRVLDEAVRGQVVVGHPVVVRRLQAAPAAPDCQVLYLARSRAHKPSDVLAALRGAPVLTVTDASQGFGGGIVHFVLRGGHVRFGIDQDGARAAGLKISSKLLALAVPAGPQGE